MKKALELAFIALTVGLLAVPGLLTLKGKTLGDPLMGVAADAKLPAIDTKGFWEETTQKGLNDWYVQHWSTRPHAVRLDNSLSYWAFGESRPEKVVKIGKQRVLWLHEMLWFVNRDDAPDVRRAAERFKRAQDLALAHEKALVLVLLPSKWRFYADALPPDWTAPLGSSSERPCDARVTTPFAEELTRIGAKFVDARKLLLDEFGIAKREVVYAATGRHLTGPAMCRVIDAAFAVARPLLPDFDVPSLDCRYEMRTDAPLDGDDYDLYRLINVWSPRPRDPIPVMLAVEDRPAYENLPDTLFVGSSFVWRLIKETDRNHALGETHTYYYNKTVFPWGAEQSTWPVAPGTDAWRELTLKKRLIIVDMPEEYLVDHNAEFLEQLTKLLSETPVAE